MCMSPEAALAAPRAETPSADFQPGPSTPTAPPGKFSIPKVEEKESSDPDIEKLIDQIRTRQWAAAEKIDRLTPGDMAFGLMRNVPRDQWNTPLTELGHWPRGSSIAEIKANPKLKNFTPAQAIEKLFEMDDAMKKAKEKK